MTQTCVQRTGCGTKNFPGLGTAAENLALRITEMTDGQLTVKVFAAGELVPPFESFDAVSSGTADMYHAAEYYWQGKDKAFNFFAAVPFGFTANEITPGYIMAVARSYGTNSREASI